MNTALVSCLPCPYIADMGEKEDALRRALEMAPDSIRLLAREAGVSDKLLRLIRDGYRTATPRTIEKLAKAMERFAERHTQAAQLLRDSTQDQEVEP